MKRLTSEDFNSLAASRGFEWTGGSVLNGRATTSWRCSEGHNWSTNYWNIKNGYNCPHCSGRAAKSEADYHAVATAKGLVWLGPRVRDVITPTTWKCASGHVWTTTFSCVHKSKGCPQCAGRVAKTEADYRALAAEHGIEWLGPMVTTQQSTYWRCPAGHIWKTKYGHIAAGTGCAKCQRDLRRRQSHDYSGLAERRGFEWLGPLVSTTHAKTGWKCSKGHVWQAPFDKIAGGKGCFECAVIRRADQRRLKPADYHELAAERGILWVGPTVNQGGVPTRWACQEGHEWETCYETVRAGHACPACAGNAKLSDKDYLAVAEERGLMWLGPVGSSKAKTGWRCPKGHEWQTVLGVLRMGCGCPYCYDMVNGAAVSKPQRKLHELLGGELNYPVGRYKVDVALCPNGVQVAVEYDCAYYHDAAHDQRRDAFLLARGWRTLRVKSGVLMPEETSLQAAIARLVAGSAYEEIVLEDWRGGN